VEMHQQPGDRNCANEAISDTHHGPVLVYMYDLLFHLSWIASNFAPGTRAKVSDASSAVGASSPWFKIYHAGYGLAAPTGAWATDVLIANCGKLTVTIPADIPAGDYLLRAEVIALHVAQSTGGAQVCQVE
jgi:cellulase